MIVAPIMGEHVSFFVDGLAETKGSFIGLGGGRVKGDNPREEGWRTTVGWRAKIAMLGRSVIAGGALVALDFYLPRPVGKKHQRDVDKLCRSCLDAMTGIVYEDDERVTSIVASKEVGNVLGVEVHVFPLLQVRASQLVAAWIELQARTAAAAR